MPSYRIVYVSASEFARRVREGAVRYGVYAIVGFETFGGEGIAYAVKEAEEK